MPRFLYTLIFYLALPLIVLRLLYRAWKAPAYARRWHERFGFFNKPVSQKKAIWVHTVSVGESIAAAPLVRQLMKAFPEHRMVVTTMTPTGSEQVKNLYGDTVFHVYAPYDLPGAVHRFLNRIQPELAVIMETELWPNTIAACQRRGIPALLTNARLSERSARGYGKAGGLARDMLQQLSAIAAQGEDDARRFINLGFPEQRMQVTGTLKYDLQVSDTLKAEGKELRQQWLSGRSDNSRILIAASTHRGEDEQIIEAFQILRADNPELLLIVVPRHQERFEEVFQLLKKSGLTTKRRSLNEPVDPKTHVMIGDTMGELVRLFATADLAFVGGSLVEHGGHNPLEPAALGLPVICGPHVFNFADVTATLNDAGALLVVNNSQELAAQVKVLLSDQQAWNAASKAATLVMEQNKGALARQVEIAQSLMNWKV